MCICSFHCICTCICEINKGVNLTAIDILDTWIYYIFTRVMLRSKYFYLVVSVHSIQVPGNVCALSNRFLKSNVIFVKIQSLLCNAKEVRIIPPSINIYTWLWNLNCE